MEIAICDVSITPANRYRFDPLFAVCVCASYFILHTDTETYPITCGRKQKNKQFLLDLIGLNPRKRLTHTQFEFYQFEASRDESGGMIEL